MPVHTERTVNGVLESLTDERLVLALPGTDYRVHLVPAVPASSFAVPPGKRIRGTVQARALRMHPARGGGSFIEPVLGPPRIVAGVVRQVDLANGRVLIESALPIWVEWPEGQDTTLLQEGALVNFYVESGTSFTPA
jgi:hypothetical protein